MPALQTKEAKETRIYIRATLSQKELINRAAEKEKTNVSDFILENSVSAAEAVVNDDANYTLDKKRFAEFCAALDAPPRPIDALRKLLTEPSVFDAE